MELLKVLAGVGMLFASPAAIAKDRCAETPPMLVPMPVEKWTGPSIVRTPCVSEDAFAQHPDNNVLPFAWGADLPYPKNAWPKVIEVSPAWPE